ncbi:MAG: hypothetical protein WCO98_11275, partial [bacterium]
VSYPITLLVSGFFGYYAEIIPMIFEPFLYIYILDDFYKIKINHIIPKVIAANLVSFVAGIFIFDFLSHEMVKKYSIFNYF